MRTNNRVRDLNSIKNLFRSSKLELLDMPPIFLAFNEGKYL